MRLFGAPFFHLVIWLVLPAGLCFAGQSNPPGAIHISAKDTSSIRTAPKAVFPKRTHNFGEVFEGKEIKYDFVVENKGDAPLVIKNIRPD
jgi:hypothetical protein